MSPAADVVAAGAPRCSRDDVLVLARTLWGASLRYAPDLRDGLTTRALLDAWHAALGGYDPAILLDAAEELARTLEDWPTVGEVEPVCRRLANRAAAIRRGLENPHGGSVCGRCSGERFVETAQSLSGGGTPFVYPCPDCHHELFLRWKEGHLRWDHPRETCETCLSAASGGRRRR